MPRQSRPAVTLMLLNALARRACAASVDRASAASPSALTRTCCTLRPVADDDLDDVVGLVVGAVRALVRLEKGHRGALLHDHENAGRGGDGGRAAVTKRRCTGSLDGAPGDRGSCTPSAMKAVLS